jgi:hypothetical protein
MNMAQLLCESVRPLALSVRKSTHRTVAPRNRQCLKNSDFADETRMNADCSGAIDLAALRLQIVHCGSNDNAFTKEITNERPEDSLSD